ncbi:hypothetical protein BH23PLA1_BH23PLA1_06180 [soil metagenome]
MQFHFDFGKVLQAAGVLLHLDGKRMSRLRLLKLLYIADRELIAEVGRTISGDCAVAMKNGPVLSRTYDLIKGESGRAGEWDNYSHSEGYAVELRSEPGRGRLSKYEIEKLTEVSDRYRRLDDFDLSELTHQFPEWQRNYRSCTSTPISWVHVLESKGREELVQMIEEDEAARRTLHEMFG